MVVSRNNSAKFPNIDYLKESLSTMSKNGIDLCFMPHKKSYEFRQMKLAMSINLDTRIIPEVSSLPVDILTPI